MRVKFFTVIITLVVLSCNGQQKNQEKSMSEQKEKQEGLETAVFAGGCFWCIEAIFESLKGVKEAVSGYAGGDVPDPTYKLVCTGTTGHAEVVKITYDPKIISYSDLLEVFWHVHDPTTLNRQGNDVGTQYRSAIFYVNDNQKQLAKESMKASQESGLWEGRYTTLIEPLTAFYPAEDYHSNYFENNPQNPYCNAVVAPKVAKFRKKFKDKLK